MGPPSTFRRTSGPARPAPPPRAGARPATAPPAAGTDGAVEGGHSPAATLGLAPPRVSSRTALGREMRYTLRRGWDYLIHMPKVEPDPFLLLRAARTCWLLDDMDAMCVYYRDAAVQLQEVVDVSGRRTGTAADYWRLALGALWMVSVYSREGRERQADEIALRSFAIRVMDVADRLSTEAAQPLDRMALDMVRLRAAWYANDPEFQRVLSTVDQRATAMEANSRGLWQGERDFHVLAALKVITRERPERMPAVLTQYDEYLVQNVERPPTVMELVDEDLLALEAASLKARAPRTSLRTAPRAGSRRSDVL